MSVNIERLREHALLAPSGMEQTCAYMYVQELRLRSLYDEAEKAKVTRVDALSVATGAALSAIGTFAAASVYAPMIPHATGVGVASAAILCACLVAEIRARHRYESAVAEAAKKLTDLKQVENDPHSAAAIYDRALTFVGSLAKDDLTERADPTARRCDRFPG